MKHYNSSRQVSQVADLRRRLCLGENVQQSAEAFVAELTEPHPVKAAIQRLKHLHEVLSAQLAQACD